MTKYKAERFVYHLRWDTSHNLQGACLKTRCQVNRAKAILGNLQDVLAGSLRLCMRKYLNFLVTHGPLTTMSLQLVAALVHRNDSN